MHFAKYCSKVFAVKKVLHAEQDLFLETFDIYLDDIRRSTGLIPVPVTADDANPLPLLRRTRFSSEFMCGCQGVCVDHQEGVSLLGAYRSMFELNQS